MVSSDDDLINTYSFLQAETCKKRPEWLMDDLPLPCLFSF